MEALALPYDSEERPAGSAYFFRRLSVENYKSIGKSDVALQPLTLIVGRNGSGKSNLLDALRFVAESLQTSLEHAIKSRGGIDAVRRKSAGHPRNFSIKIEVVLPGHQVGTFSFEVVAQKQGGFVVGREYARIESHGQVLGSYSIEKSKVVRGSIANLPPAFADRLYLVTASGFPIFRPLYDALSSMGFYNLNPEAMRHPQPPDAGELLHRDGSNIASVIARLSADKPEIMKRVRSYLSTIVPGILQAERVAVGPMETLLFKQEVAHSPRAWNFYALSMSDGTLRALGALVAVTQLADRKVPVSLVGIEEPETALHPAAVGALMDALREAAAHTQILVTSHSPDLLDHVDPESEGLLIVRSQGGETRVAPVDAASRSAIRDHLYSPGELLRMDQLEPDRSDLARQEQLKLFPSAGKVT